MKTIEVSDKICAAIEKATDEEANSLLLAAASDFVDVTTMDADRGERKFIHSLTGRVLTVRADWTD